MSDVNRIKDDIKRRLSECFGVSENNANEEQIYKAVAMSVNGILNKKYTRFSELRTQHKSKHLYYMSMEFLIGPQLKNNLNNIMLYDDYREALSEMNFSLDEILNYEIDPALGNGGLGRLAACYADSLTSLDYSFTGFSVCYEYGFFKQKITDGNQEELPDDWLENGSIWLQRREYESVMVEFGGNIREKNVNGKLNFVCENAEKVRAVPHDIMISGYDSMAVNKLRLWKAESAHAIDMPLFSQGEYAKSMQKCNEAEIISKMLYPTDNHDAGKILRLKQQYFLTSASVQSILREHLRNYGTLDNLADKVAVHLNDTHPSLCIPELMRILMDEYSFSWDDAWKTTKNIFTYTNHTVMPEALEMWGEGIFKRLLPRIYMIVCEINRRQYCELECVYGSNEIMRKMSIISDGSIKMANLCVWGSNKVNGVSELHSKILKESIFDGFCNYQPNKFANVTNGIAHRRWLCCANPELAKLLDECIGTEYRKEPQLLGDFRKFEYDACVLDRLGEIKKHNKIILSNMIKDKYGIASDPMSVFDVQAKRIHEYKRQLLNVLRIINNYLMLKENPNMDVTPQTFIFAGKAAPSYYAAKEIISLICALSREIERDASIKGKMNVVFIEDYNVSLAERIIPAAEISEQISLAGKEASGTGNMKFMINGALTIATLDGANIEMCDAIGKENMFLFGLNAYEVNNLQQNGYNSKACYESDKRIKHVVDMLGKGVGGKCFDFIKNYLLNGNDPFMCLADFGSYCSAHENAVNLYLNKFEWNRKALINISSAGVFSADRAVKEYASQIWGINKIKL